MQRLSHFSRILIEVIIQDWPHIIRYKYYLHIAHLFTLTVGGTFCRCHCWRTNQQPISRCDNCITVD